MRNVIRVVIPAAAIAAVAIGIALPVGHKLPSTALGSQELLWLERALVLFYGFLLLFVPILRALEGILPIELSARGARYADISERAIDEFDARITTVEDLVEEAIDTLDGEYTE